MIEGTLGQIAEKMPNGFHDTSLQSLVVDWANSSVLLTGIAWVAEDGPSEVYRPFSVAVNGIQTVIVPEQAVVREQDGSLWRLDGLPSRIDGIEGWPPGKEPVAARPGAFTYSFFLNRWNDFVVVHALGASLEWLGPPEQRVGRRTSG